MVSLLCTNTDNTHLDRLTHLRVTIPVVIVAINGDYFFILARSQNDLPVVQVRPRLFGFARDVVSVLKARCGPLGAVIGGERIKGIHFRCLRPPPIAIRVLVFVTL